MRPFRIRALALPVPTLITPVVNLAKKLRRRPAAALLELPLQVLDFVLEAAVLIAELLLLLLQPVNRLLQLIFLAAVSALVVAGVIQGLAEGLVIGCEDADLFLELRHDDVAQVVGFCLGSGEACLQGVDLGDETTVCVLEAALPLFDTVPFINTDSVVVSGLETRVVFW